MKNIKYIILTIMFSVFMSSCSEDALLTENPKDFLTPENSFNTPEGFEAVIGNLHASLQASIFGSNDAWQRFVHFGQDVDIAVSGLSETGLWYAIRWNTLTPDNGTVRDWWRTYYSLIFKANTIIGRAESDNVKWDSEEQKNAIVGEAKFVRAYAYHFLANMWGGVPIVLEETTSEKFDYTRATREAVYQQCVDDLTFATQWMNKVDGNFRGGQIPRAAAYHVLSEVKIAMNDYAGAITAASAVIDDPNFALMTERFGVYKDFTFTGFDYKGAQEPWGDVYWDLFRDGNFHRSEGNTEAIWNINMKFEAEGIGYPVSHERWWGPYEWVLKDVDGVSTHLKDTLMGRPVGVIRPTKYASEDIWNYKGDWNNDIRNNKHNIKREFYHNNPASNYFGEVITPANANPANNNFRSAYPYFQKFAGAVHYGVSNDPISGQPHDNGRNFKDVYFMRLAETYLLRAEAHHLNGANDLAANDINAIRGRAQATLVTGGDVDLDLILDERARELYGEELRVNTLLRMGKLKEYLRKYHHATQELGLTYADGGFLDLLPIPQREIDANKDAVLEQNPGY